MNLTIQYKGKEYLLIYNNQSGYYEIELESGLDAGIEDINIEAKDILGNVSLRETQVQILIVEKDINKYKEKDICYILDSETLEIKDIKKITDYKIETDDETNSNSSIVFAQEFNANDEDYILIKTKSEIYKGIFTEITQEKHKGDYQAKIKHISNIFDEDIFVENENLIKKLGVEDFIKYTIEKNFSLSNDLLLNKKYIKVIAKTHTKINKSVDNDNGKYNFHTYITNCKQNYDINMNYEFINKELVITIEKKDDIASLIDCTLADIVDYKEVFEKKITAKVRVLCKDTSNIKEYCLTVNKNVQELNVTSYEDRVYGKTKCIVIEKEEEAYQSAVNEFKGNDYNFLVEFSLNGNSKIMDVSRLISGTPIKIKTKSNIMLNGYITGRIEEKNSNIISFKAGKIRRSLTQKLKKEGTYK